MELTYERWQIERRHLEEAIDAAAQKDPNGRLVEAFRRALARLGKHPIGLTPDEPLLNH